MRLALLLLLALATPALADQKVETVTTATTNTAVAVARNNRSLLFVQNIGPTNFANCCYTATTCAANAGNYLAANGGSTSFGPTDNMNGAVVCTSTTTPIYVLETFR